MKTIYYCQYCEKDVFRLASVDETYNNRNIDDEIVELEYHGMCLDCTEQADKDYWSNFDYHQGLLV